MAIVEDSGLVRSALAGGVPCSKCRRLTPPSQLVSLMAPRNRITGNRGLIHRVVADYIAGVLRSEALFMPTPTSHTDAYIHNPTVLRLLVTLLLESHVSRRSPIGRSLQLPDQS